MYRVLIKYNREKGWIEKKFDHIVEALNCVRVHHHTRLIYPCNSIAEYIQGTMIDLR